MKNNIPNTFGMLQHFGMSNRNRVLVSESANLNTAGLAAALRIDESEVIARRYPAHGRGHRGFFGLHIMKSRIEDKVRRFSPAAIAQGVLYHPATHELRDLPFSTVGWDLLQDTCPCTDDGVRQNWVTVNGSSRCHSCGGSLGKIPPVPVPRDLRTPLELVAGLVDPNPGTQQIAQRMLPAALRNVSRNLVYDIIMNLARATSARRAEEAPPPERTQAIASAATSLLDWPHGLGEISRSNECPAYVWEWVTRNYAILDVVAPSTVTSSCCTPSTAGAQASTQPAYIPSGAGGRVLTHFVGAMAAARLGGVDESALKAAWDDEKFTQHSWAKGSLRVRAFDPAEVVKVAPFLRVIGARARVASLLGLPVYGVEQLLAHCLLTPEAPSGQLKQCASYKATALELVADIEGKVTDLADPIRLVEAIRHISGRPKPWGAVIAGMLDGTLPFSVCDGGPYTAIVDRLLIEADAIPMVVRLSEPDNPKAIIERANTWSQGDALECLNGNVSAGQLLTGIVFTGRKKKRFKVEDILERAALGVTTSDVARRSGISIMRTAMILEEQAVPQIAPGLWLRARAEQVLVGPIRLAQPLTNLKLHDAVMHC
ncbi:hypothetical protein OKW76_12075 [Sphingomonas sp. S1-29]|uniref:hypothetical protein n=1 Tax=Sphingomonas sp. S1-29 TaxID=2991074 RepID=UPI0022409B2E|nr:hypothetical protein [Sphingomonas sp. S1-29]UZK68771.1 hypothetical protein OKW76_12075 [Sphingomonas sp. S1-29]